MNKLKWIIFMLLLTGNQSLAFEIPTSPKAEQAIANVEKQLKKELKAKGLEYGAAIFIRIFKDPGVLEAKTLSKYQSNQWYRYWLNLKEGYDYFNKHKRPPNVEVSGGVYVFSEK